MKKQLLAIVVAMFIASSINVSAQRFLSTSEKWALVINTAYSLEDDLQRYTEECAMVYETLRQHGYDSEQIIVLGGVHSASLHNAVTYETEYNKKKQDASLANLKMGIDRIKERINGGHLFIYITGPAGIHVTDENFYQGAYLYLFDNNTLSDQKLADLLSSISASSMNILIQSDHAGGFVYELQSKIQSHTVITTACAASEVAKPTFDSKYGDFTYWWLTAVNGQTPDTHRQYNADITNDKYISMFEAYHFTSQHHTSDNNIDQFDNPNCFALDWTLYGEIGTNCVNPTLIDGYDLFMKDNPADVGNEPNTTTNACYISEDIWFEDYNHNKTYTLGSKTQYDACVRIRNRGTLPSNGNERLFLHWTKAKIGGSWPHGWTGQEYECAEGYTVLAGNYMTTSDPLFIEVPAGIEPGKSAIIKSKWITPDASDYKDCPIFHGQENEIPHFCVLARLYDDNAHPGESMQPENFASMVLNSNNVISKNVIINYWVSDIPVGLVSSNCNLEDIHIISGKLTLPYPSCYNVFIYLDDDLYNQYLLGGSTCSGLREDSIGRFRILSPNFSISGLCLQSNRLYYVKVGLEQREPKPCRMQINLDLTNETAKDYIGGHLFEYDLSEYSNNYRRSMQEKNKKIQSEQEEEESNCIKLIGNQSINRVDVYTLTGQKILSADSYEAASQIIPVGTYIVDVETTDGNHLQYKKNKQ